MDHDRLIRHRYYSRTRKDVDALIGALMDRGSWFEASLSDGDWTVVCPLAPTELPSMVRELIVHVNVNT